MSSQELIESWELFVEEEENTDEIELPQLGIVVW
jgi:hypothetical protein